MNVSLRRAERSDASPITDLYVRARQAAAAAGTIPPLAHAERAVAQWMHDIVLLGRDTWVAEADSGQLVGLLVLRGNLIEQLYVDPELTGNGIGSRLIEQARRQQPGKLRLVSFAANHGARRFYERHGFVAVGTDDGSGNEEREPQVEYVLRSRGAAG